MNNLYSTSNISTYEKIRRYTTYIVQEYATKHCDSYYLQLYDIPDIEINSLLTLFIEYNDRDLCDINNEDVACSIIHMLDNDNSESYNLLSKTIRNKLLSTYKDKMQIIINEMCAECFVDDKEELGLTRYVHIDNNESYWR